MDWTRSNTLALARLSCKTCRGLGLTRNAADQDIPCNCVLRKIFGACHRRFKGILTSPKGPGAVRFEHTGTGHSTRMRFGRKSEEFVADFQLVVKRFLVDGSREFLLFKQRYYLGADVKLIARRAGMTPDNLDHHFERMEIKLGRAFAEMEPFAMFPMDQYFSDHTIGEKVPVSDPEKRAAA